MDTHFLAPVPAFVQNPRRCFNCNEVGHVKRNCPQLARKGRRAADNRRHNHHHNHPNHHNHNFRKQQPSTWSAQEYRIIEKPTTCADLERSILEAEQAGTVDQMEASHKHDPHLQLPSTGSPTWMYAASITSDQLRSVPSWSTMERSSSFTSLADAEESMSPTFSPIASSPAPTSGPGMMIEEPAQKQGVAAISVTDKTGHFVALPGMVFGENQEYCVIRELGKGTFATVVEAEDLRRSQRVAIKVVKNSPEALADAEDEIRILTELHHAVLQGAESDGMLLVQSVFWCCGHRCIVMPQFGQSLFDTLKQRQYRGLPVPYVVGLTFHILSALRNLHNLRLIHCDLKPENILHTTDPSSVHTTLVDYGCSYYDYDSKPSVIQSEYYRAPEVLIGAPWSYSADMWSVGCIVFELITGKPLFSMRCIPTHIRHAAVVTGSRYPKHLVRQGTNAAMKEVFNMRTARFHSEGYLKVYDRASSSYEYIEDPPVLSEALAPYNVPPQLVDLLHRLLAVDPQERATVAEALEHPLFHGMTKVSPVPFPASLSPPTSA